MVLFFFGYESLSKGYNVLNEFMFQSHMRFCCMQWLPTRFYGSLSVYSRPLPSKKNSPFAAQLKIAFRRFLFLHTLTSIYGQNWSCEKIPKSQNSDKATLFSSVVHIASSVQKVSYSKPLHNKSCCLNTMKSFLAFKVISTWIFVYFQKVCTMKLWQNTQFTTAILFCFIFTA